MSKRSRSSLGSNLITCWSVTHWASTPRGMQYPQPQKTAGTFRPLERGGIAPKAIAAISFTRASAEDLRSRIHDCCMNQGQDVRVSTLHALALRALRAAGLLTA